MKVIPLANFMKKSKKKPLCPKCKVGMEFDINVIENNTYGIPFREKHNDAIFECEKCRKYYVVLDYAEGKK